MRGRFAEGPTAHERVPRPRVVRGLNWRTGVHCGGKPRRACDCAWTRRHWSTDAGRACSSHPRRASAVCPWWAQGWTRGPSRGSGYAGGPTRPVHPRRRVSESGSQSAGHRACGYGASSHQAPGAAGGRARPRCVSACGHGLQRRGLRAAEGVEGGGQRREPLRVGGLRRRAEGTACRCPRARLSATRHWRSVLACPESGAWVVM